MILTLQQFQKLKNQFSKPCENRVRLLKLKKKFELKRESLLISIPHQPQQVQNTTGFDDDQDEQQTFSREEILNLKRSIEKERFDKQQFQFFGILF